MRFKNYEFSTSLINIPSKDMLFKQPPLVVSFLVSFNGLSFNPLDFLIGIKFKQLQKIVESRKHRTFIKASSSAQIKSRETSEKGQESHCPNSFYVSIVKQTFALQKDFNT